MSLRTLCIERALTLLDIDWTIKPLWGSSDKNSVLSYVRCERLEVIDKYVSMSVILSGQDPPENESNLSLANALTNTPRC